MEAREPVCDAVRERDALWLGVRVSVSPVVTVCVGDALGDPPCEDVAAWLPLDVLDPLAVAEPDGAWLGVAVRVSPLVTVWVAVPEGVAPWVGLPESLESGESTRVVDGEAETDADALPERLCSGVGVCEALELGDVAREPV